MAVAPQNIMAQLRGMPDAQLAQYAAMHKNDPFIFPLAFQESQTRKQMRLAKDAQMAGMQQPKVVDQDLQQMMPAMAQPAPQQTAQLPENIGIGQLPAQNLQRMAGGGIVAFEEGGEVPSFGDGGDTGYWDPNTGEYVIGEKRDERSFGDKFKSAIGWKQGLNINPRGGMQQDFQIPESTLKGTGSTAEIDKMATDVAASQKNRSKPNANANLTMAESGKDTGGGKTPAATAPGISALTAGYSATTPEDLMKTSRVMAGDANKESEAAYNPYAAMLKKERSDLEARKDSNLTMSLLKAGLKTLGGKSQYASQNISEGGIEGLNTYQEANRADDAAKKALMGSEIALMQAQRAERSGNHKDAVALLGQAEQSKQFGVTAALKAEEMKNTAAYQQGMIGVQQGRNAILGAHNAQSNKQMAEYGKIQANVTKALANDMTYAGLKTDAERQAYKTRMLQQEIANNPFLSALGAGIGFVPQASGKVVGDFTGES